MENRCVRTLQRGTQGVNDLRERSGKRMRHHFGRVETRGGGPWPIGSGVRGAVSSGRNPAVARTGRGTPDRTMS